MQLDCGGLNNSRDVGGEIAETIIKYRAIQSHNFPVKNLLLDEFYRFETEFF